MWRWVVAAGGLVIGGALGLVGPVFLLRALNVGTGSYEDVLAVWLASVPLGSALGAFLGFVAGRRMTR